MTWCRFRFICSSRYNQQSLLCRIWYADDETQETVVSAPSLRRYVAPAPVMPAIPAMRQITAHSASLTGQTDRRDWRSSAMPASSGTPFHLGQPDRLLHRRRPARHRPCRTCRPDRPGRDRTAARSRRRRRSPCPRSNGRKRRGRPAASPQIVRRLEVAHAVPMGAAVPDHLVPGILRRFGFQAANRPCRLSHSTNVPAGLSPVSG